MEHLKPLIESAAWWVQVDATLRLVWSAVGVVVIAAAWVTAIWIIRKLLRTPTEGQRQ